MRKKHDRSNIEVLVGLRIRELRHQTGLSQERLALQAGLDRTYMNSVENGRRNISIRSLTKIAKALGVSLSEFFSSSPFQ